MKRLFDTIRSIAGRPLKQAEVDKVNEVLAPAKQSAPDNWLALALPLIQRFEGCERKRPDGRYEAYVCAGGVWTVGWGSTGPGIGKGTIWTKAECDDRLMRDVTERYGAQVKRLLGSAPTTPHQMAALVSFTYNLGAGALQRSTLLRKHIDGNTKGAADEFQKWVFADGKRLRGLEIRRSVEAALYRS